MKRLDLDIRIPMATFGGTVLLSWIGFFCVNAPEFEYYLYDVGQAMSYPHDRIEIICAADVYLIVFALPCLLTITAKRHPLLWGILPFPIAIGCDMVCRFLVGAAPLRLDPNPTEVLRWAMYWSFGAVPGLIIRWLIRRTASKRKPVPAAAAAPADPNAWPPPPRE